MAVATAAIIGAGAAVYGAISSNERAKEQMGLAADATGDQLRFQKAQQAKLDKQKSVYRQFQFENPYADIENAYAGLQTQFENVYEDLTVGTQAAEFQMEQGAQQRANIMQGLQGAAGGSGIAGLAQAMANQAQQQTQQASASIGQQEATQQRLMAQQAGRIQMAERGGEAQAERVRLSGAESARGLEWQKTGTLLGMAQERKHAADEARAQATQNLTGGIGQVAGSILTGGIL